MNVFRNIVAAYKSREGNGFAVWAKGNPDEAKILARAEMLASKVKNA